MGPSIKTARPPIASQAVRDEISTLSHPHVSWIYIRQERFIHVAVKLDAKFGDHVQVLPSQKATDASSNVPRRRGPKSDLRR